MRTRERRHQRVHLPNVAGTAAATDKRRRSSEETPRDRSPERRLRERLAFFSSTSLVISTFRSSEMTGMEV